jgi:hypothetical protein
MGGLPPTVPVPEKPELDRHPEGFEEKNHVARPLLSVFCFHKKGLADLIDAIAKVLTTFFSRAMQSQAH